MKAAVRNNPANRRLCLCPDCPSYPKACSGEVLYCAVGKSGCDISARGCLCDGCPVYFKYKLNGLYYCDKAAVGASGYVMRKKRPGEDNQVYETITAIKDAAQSGRAPVVSMGSLKKLPFSFNDFHFLPAQIYKIPLNRQARVETGVIIGPAALIAINCEQYRICHTGLCPTGVTTHRPALTKLLDPAAGAKKLANFIKAATEEIAGLTRAVGKNDVKKLTALDLVCLHKDLAELAGVKWLDGKNIKD